MNAIVQALVLVLMTLDRLLLFAAFVSVAGEQRLTHPFQNLIVELLTGPTETAGPPGQKE